MAKRNTPHTPLRLPSDAHAVHYKVEAADLHAHLYGVTLTIAQPAAQQRVSLPVWIAGSYMVREFAKQITGINARQGQRAVTVKQLDKATWEVDCEAGRPLTLHYQVHAHDDSVRTAWLTTERGFFNGTSLCLQAEGLADVPHALELVAESFNAAHTARTSAWQVATGLTPVKTDRQGFGTYAATDYDELVDCPVEMGAFWSGSFKACGIEHRFVVAGATPAFDGERLLRDSQKICETAIRFWHGNKRSATPHKNYVFMLNAVADGYGGLEHRNSTALICNRADLPRVGDAKLSDGYTTLLGLISHEYFHTWNVKRLRPAEFARYDYTQENYTELLWFFEGFTSYYDDLLLRRAGLVDDAQYLKLLNKTINQVLQTPGREVHSVAQSSFEAWTKYYRQDANSPNLTVSYYTKGALVALCLDLSLRQHGVKNHSVSLDDVMRALWVRCCTGKGNETTRGPMTEADVLAVLKELTGRSWSAEFKAWVHGTHDLPLEQRLAHHGVSVQHDPAQLTQRLGLRVTEDHSVQIKTVLNGSAAHKAGFAPGDEWLGVEVGGMASSAWRIKKLDDLLLYAGSAKKVTVLVSRDRQLLRLSLALPDTKVNSTWRLVMDNPKLVSRWLGL
jgi:predicted metalloprotease with PDZ domain